MDIDIQDGQIKRCMCDNIPKITHELNQSLLIIYAYGKGCFERIQKDELNLNQLIEALDKILKYIELMSSQVRSLMQVG